MTKEGVNIVDLIAGTLGDKIHEVYRGDELDFETFLEYCEEYLIEYVGEETPHGEYGTTEKELIFKHKDKYYSVKIHNISWNRYDKQYYFIEMWEKAKITYKEVTPILPTKGLIEQGIKGEYNVTRAELNSIAYKLKEKGLAEDSFQLKITI